MVGLSRPLDAEGVPVTAAVIVQARRGSGRFPDKVLADLCGRPVLWHVLTRAKQVAGIDVVVCAMPDEDRSKALEAIANDCGIITYRGPEDDVLARYVGAARAVDADLIVRVTADCPLIDPEVCAQVLATAKATKADYASNVVPRTFEKGLDCEAFTREALEFTHRFTAAPYDREHVCPFMQRHPDFRRVNVESGDPRRAETNWCIDHPEDLERVEAVLSAREAA